MTKSRLDRINEYYQHASILNVNNPIYKDRFLKYINNALKNDVGNGDITTHALFRQKRIVEAVISSEEDGVIAGVSELELFYTSNGVNVKIYTEDGTYANAGTIILSLKGDLHKILSMERTGLNLMRRMSGIATTTFNFVNLIKNFDTKISATRKVLLDEMIEKRAVSLGGGFTHRIGLDNFVLIKDCHLSLIDSEPNITEALKRICSANISCPVEIEVENTDEALIAAKIFNYYGNKLKGIIMLDNFSQTQICDTIALLKKNNLYDSVLLEASGGINYDNLIDYAKSGIDIISTSAITEAAKSLNLHQEIKK